MPRLTADDRSKEVPLHGLRTGPVRWFRASPVPRDVMTGISRRARAAAEARRKGPAHTAALMYISGVFGLMFCYRQLSEGYPEIARVLAGGGVAALTALLIYRTKQDDSLTRFIVAAFLEARRCPSCGRDLAEVGPGDDGCSVCPECGAAWRLAPTSVNPSP